MWLIASVGLPLFVFAFIVHRLERLIQIRLAERWGWKSVLWTGWLGTPLHELSHAAMCLLFRHKIDEMQLFEPDLKTGRLGYVKHSFRKGNWFEEIGNVFIGVAPLGGGVIGLALLLLIFFPSSFNEAIQMLRERGEDQSVWQITTDTTLAIVQSVCTWGNLVTPKFWLFLYLVLCVGNHMAPSPSDYAGARRGILMLAVVIFAVVFLLCLATGNPEKLLPTVMEILAPIFAVLLLAIILCIAAYGVVFLVTMPFQKKYQFRQS